MSASVSSLSAASVASRTAATFLLLLLPGAVAVYAGTPDSWTNGGADSQWSTATNWSVGLPGTGNDALNTTAFSIIHSTGTDTINSYLSSGTGAFSLTGGSIAAGVPGTSAFQVDGAFSLNGGTLSGFVLNAGSPLTVSVSNNNFLNNIVSNVALDLSSGGVLRVTNGLSLNNTATLTGNGILAFQGDQTLGGTGSVRFGDTSGSNRLNIDGNTTLTIGSGQTIHGITGQISVGAFVGGTGNLVNNGLISSDGGGTITINNNGLFTNNNVLEARNSSTLNLNQSVINGGGVINVVDATSRVTQNGIAITGGTINVAAGGDFLVTNSGANFLNGVTVNGNLDLTNSGTERVTGGLTNNGVATIGVNGILAFQGDQTLGGTGSVRFGDTSGSNRLNIDGNTTLTIGSGQTIHGITGQISVGAFVGGTGNLVNNGVISSDGGGTITVNNNGTVINSGGTFSSAVGSTLVSNQNITQTGGATVANGTITLNAGNGALNIGGGTLVGNGTLNGSVIDTGGTISAGSTSTAGLLTLSGSLTDSAASLMIVNLGGTAQGSTYDYLNMSGTASLAGTLDVSLIAGFAPTVGETFDVVGYKSVTGAFSTITGTNSGYTYTAQYLPTLLRLTVNTIGSTNATPEPGSVALLFLGIPPVVAIGVSRRRRKA